MTVFQGNPVSDSYDHIIVGGGSAGCLIASRLSNDNGRSVLLIEAGSSEFDRATISDPTRWIENLGSDIDWKYQTVPQRNVDERVFTWSSGKVLGGSSSINATVWVWGHPSDYDWWASEGNVGWDFLSLEPVFQRLESTIRIAQNASRGIHGRMRLSSTTEVPPLAGAFFEACRATGHSVRSDVNGPVREGGGTFDLTSVAGRRFSVAQAFLQPAIGRPGLTILTGADVESLVFEGTTCVGVRCHHNGRLEEFRSRSDILLCAGTIGTPRLLLRSGVGNSEELGKLRLKVSHDLPGVGENLHDHCLINAFSAETADLVEKEGRLGAHLYARSRRALSSPDFEVAISAGALGVPNMSMDKSFSLSAALLRPLSRGRLTLADNTGAVSIDPNYFSISTDADVLCEAVETCAEIAASPALSMHCAGNIHKPPHQRAQLLEHIKSTMNTYWHPVGTCAMGIGRYAVVDPSLRVHGMSNLRIADSSVMPSITTGNTLAPTLVIAERAASMILANV
jgi:choline dehydrogenase